MDDKTYTLELIDTIKGEAAAKLDMNDEFFEIIRTLLEILPKKIAKYILNKPGKKSSLIYP